MTRHLTEKGGAAWGRMSTGRGLAGATTGSSRSSRRSCCPSSRSRSGVVRVLLRAVEHRSRLYLAQASTARTEANRSYLDAGATKDFDASTFNTWFSAYLAGNEPAMAVAEKWFRPEFKVAFDVWLATDPTTNPDAPPGPTYMPEYVQPEIAKAEHLDAKADRLYAKGAEAGGYANDYVRTTVYLATVLFLVGISALPLQVGPDRSHLRGRRHPRVRRRPAGHRTDRARLTDLENAVQATFRRGNE